MVGPHGSHGLSALYQFPRFPRTRPWLITLKPQLSPFMAYAKTFWQSQLANGKKNALGTSRDLLYIPILYLT
jgi:hypothetical protein